MNPYRGLDRGPSPAVDSRRHPTVEVAGQNADRQPTGTEVHLDNLSRIYQRLCLVNDRTLRLADMHTGSVPSPVSETGKIKGDPSSTVEKLAYAASMLDDQLNFIESNLRRLESL